MKPISEKKILSLLDNGLSSRKIAAQLGVSRATIDKYVKSRELIYRKIVMDDRRNLKPPISIGYFAQLLQARQIIPSNSPAS